MGEDEIDFLAERTGQDPAKIKTLTPIQFQKAKDRPALLEGILNGNIEVASDGTVKNTYKYREGALYKKIQAMDDNSINFLHFFSSLFFVIGPIFTKLTRKMIAIKMAVPNQCQKS